MDVILRHDCRNSYHNAWNLCKFVSMSSCSHVFNGVFKHPQSWIHTYLSGVSMIIDNDFPMNSQVCVHMFPMTSSHIHVYTFPM